LRGAVSLLVASIVLFMSTSVSAEGLKWSKDMKTAWKTAQETEQPLLLFVSSTNCSYCERMKKQTLRDESIVKQVSESFVAVKVDAKEDTELLKKLKIRLLPTTVIVKPNGAVIDSIRGFQTAEQFRKRLLSTERTAAK
jgi:protein disulfide-isomerase